MFCPKKYRSSRHDNNSTDTASSSSPLLQPRRQGRNRHRQSKRARSGGGACEAEFDYDGWAVWGSWRRRELLRRGKGRRGRSRRSSRNPPPESSSRGTELEQDCCVTWETETCYGSRTRLPDSWAPCPPEQQAEVERQKERMYLGGAHDCSVHCGWPNECGHAVYAAKEAGVGWDGTASGRASREGEDGSGFGILGDGTEFTIFEDDADAGQEEAVLPEPRGTTTGVSGPSK